jgi:hypothetical protein
VKDLLVALFAISAGFTVSGIVANSYGLLTRGREQTLLSTPIALAAVIGPNILLETAATSFRKRSCSGFAFWLAASVSAYWSFVLGLFLLDLILALSRH